MKFTTENPGPTVIMIVDDLGRQYRCKIAPLVLDVTDEGREKILDKRFNINLRWQSKIEEITHGVPVARKTDDKH